MTKWVVAVVLAGSAVIAVRSGGCLNSSKAADEKLAGHFNDLCEIARTNTDDPVRGVRKLGHYFLDNTGNMYGAWGDTLMTVEKIADDEDHDDRARLARERITQPLVDCLETWGEFAEAVEANPEASMLVQNAMERLNRTLDIILGDGVGAVDFRRLPQQLIQRLAI